MKKRKRISKLRQRRAMVSLVTGNLTTMANSQNQVIWYPTLPPRKTTWITRIKEALRRIFL